MPATLLTAAAKVRVGGEEARDRVAQQRKLTARAKPVALAEARPHARGVRAVAHHNIPPRHCRAAMPARSAVRAETGMVRGCGCPGARPSENRRCSSAGSSSIAQSYGGPGRQSLGMYSHGMSPATIRHAPFDYAGALLSTATFRAIWLHGVQSSHRNRHRRASQRCAHGLQRCAGASSSLRQRSAL